MAKRRWADLSSRQRGVVIAGVAAETALKGVALLDLRRRSPAEVRGPKWAWSLGLVTISSFGIVPLAYFLIGRRSQPGH